MRQPFRISLLAACVTSALLPLAGNAAVSNDSAAVQSTWKPEEIRYSYMAFTTAYNCDAAEQRLKEILTTLGAHPQTKVQATGCNLNRPSRNFFVTITTAVPVIASEARPSADVKTEQKVIQRMGVKSDFADQQFPAEWKTVDLSRDRKLDLKPGDCELMEGLRDHVLPKLSIKVVTDRVQCMPHTLSIQPPELTVSALVPVASADKAKI